MRGISPPHNTMNNSTSKHFTKGHTMLPLSHCSHKMGKALRPTGKSCLSFRGFRSTQQDTTMSLLFGYFTPTCPVTIPAHLCTKCRQHHRRRNTVHKLCPWCGVWSHLFVLSNTEVMGCETAVFYKCMAGVHQHKVTQDLNLAISPLPFLTCHHVHSWQSLCHRSLTSTKVDIGP